MDKLCSVALPTENCGGLEVQCELLTKYFSPSSACKKGGSRLIVIRSTQGETYMGLSINGVPQ